MLCAQAACSSTSVATGGFGRGYCRSSEARIFLSPLLGYGRLPVLQAARRTVGLAFVARLLRANGLTASSAQPTLDFSSCSSNGSQRSLRLALVATGRFSSCDAFIAQPPLWPAHKDQKDKQGRPPSPGKQTSLDGLGSHGKAARRKIYPRASPPGLSSQDHSSPEVPNANAAAMTRDDVACGAPRMQHSPLRNQFGLFALVLCGATTGKSVTVLSTRHSSDDDGPVVTSLSALAAAENDCRRCPLYRNATQAVPGRGPRRAPMMLVGEPPGDQEDRAGLPFVGPAGRVLDRPSRRRGLRGNRCLSPTP